MYNVNLLVHFNKLAECLKNVGAHAELKFDTFRLELTGGGKYFELVPEFISLGIGSTTYYDSLAPTVNAFGGWRLAPRREWNLATDKLAFKEHCARHRLPTPRSFRDVSEVSGSAPLLVKEARKSSAAGTVEGPFTKNDLASRGKLRAGTFIEEFIEGDPFCAWYFDGRLACVERRSPPTVKADGRSTLRALIERQRPAVTGVVIQPVVEAMARYQGRALDSVVPEGTTVVLDYAFKSILHAIPRSSENVLKTLAGTVAHDQLTSAGPALLQGLPEPMRANSLFSAIGVIDSRQNVWFIDVEPGRFVHPDVYPALVNTLFGAPEAPPLPPDVVAGNASMTQH
jgi:hypothetical protein